LWNHRLDFRKDHGIQPREVSNDWQQAIIPHHLPLLQSADILNPIDKEGTAYLQFLNQYAATVVRIFNLIFSNTYLI